jgi:hypothetical protein
VREGRVPNSPFPNVLLDRWMPRLKDTEWRLLCVVVRQTLGWQGVDGTRKQQDWLTHSQLRAKTGRSSEAVSHALDSLVKQGLLEVRDEVGLLMDTPAKRRKHLGRLFLALGSACLLSPTLNDKGDSTVRSESRTTMRESEIRKPKTTKETEYKKIPLGTCAYPPQSENVSSSDVVRFLQAYRDLFRRRSVRGEAPPLSWNKEGVIARRLLAQYGYDRLRELLERFFLSDDPWVRQRGYALACFPALLPHILMSDTSRRTALHPPAIHSNSGSVEWERAAPEKPSPSLFERYPHLRPQKPSAPQSHSSPQRP